MNISMVVTDLDGTLAGSGATVSTINRETLEQLGRRGVCRVIASGRNLYSARRILDKGFPIDYLIFSCGAGILDWKNDTILNEEHLDKKTVGAITGLLIDQKIDFSVQDRIPDNHCFSYIQHNLGNEDFVRRLEIYQGYTRAFDARLATEASQIIAILGEDVERFADLKNMCEQIDVKIVRATSPLNGRSIWMEFLPPQVSKASGIHFLCQRLGIDRQQTLGIGNDFNDIDLLEFCQISYVVSNAPNELKSSYPSVSSCDADGFTAAIKLVFA